MILLLSWLLLNRDKRVFSRATPTSWTLIGTTSAEHYATTWAFHSSKHVTTYRTWLLPCLRKITQVFPISVPLSKEPLKPKNQDRNGRQHKPSSNSYSQTQNDWTSRNLHLRTLGEQIKNNELFLFLPPSVTRIKTFLKIIHSWSTRLHTRWTLLIPLNTSIPHTPATISAPTQRNVMKRE